MNGLGKNTVNILKESFKYVDELIESEDETIAMDAADKFIEIIDELSSVGLQKMVKIYTFDESMNVAKVEREGDVKISVGKMEGDISVITKTGGDARIEKVIERPAAPEESFMDKFAKTATVAQFLGWVGGSALIYYGYARSNNISVVIGVVLFLFLLIARWLKKI